MPMTPEVRRLGPRWPALIANVASYSANIPAEGVALSVFTAECLAMVDFDSRDAIIQALCRRRVIFKARLGLEWRTFGRPVGQRFAEPGDVRVKAFVQVVAPHVERIGKMIDESRGATPNREVRAMHKEAADQIAKLVSRHVARGASFPAMRDALWRTFRPDALAVLARYEGGLDRESRLDAPLLPPAKVASVPRGSPPLDRIIALVERAGSKGATKGDLREHFPKPRPKSEEMDLWLAQACEADILRCESMKIASSGRAGLRYFHYDHASPRVVMGVAVVD